MPTPVVITDLSQTASSNFPAGSDSPAALDDTQRAHASFIAQLRDGKGFTNPVVVASATTTDIGGQNSQFVEISGTTTITSFGTTYNGPRFLRFQGVLTLTHNATTLNIPGGASVTTAAGDIAIAYPNAALNGWNIANYQRAATFFFAAAGANTDITSLASPAIGAATATTQAPGDNSTKVATTAYTDAAVAASGVTPPQPTVTNPSNTLVISFSQLKLSFRNTNLTTGSTTQITGTPASLTIAATDSFGLTTAFGNQRLAILAINNAGTIELAASALYGGVALDETGVITTATAVTTATGIKAANVRTGVAYQVIGFVDATFTTAVGWGSVALVQSKFGQALADLSSLGYGQTWQNVTGSRVVGTTYYNTTGKPIQVVITANSTGALTTLVIGGVTLVNTTALGPHSYPVPSGQSYTLSAAGGGLNYWNELR